MPVKPWEEREGVEQHRLGAGKRVGHLGRSLRCAKSPVNWLAWGLQLSFSPRLLWLPVGSSEKWLCQVLRYVSVQQIIADWLSLRQAVVLFLVLRCFLWGVFWREKKCFCLLFRYICPSPCRLSSAPVVFMDTPMGVHDSTAICWHPMHMQPLSPRSESLAVVCVHILRDVSLLCPTPDAEKHTGNQDKNTSSALIWTKFSFRPSKKKEKIHFSEALF